MYDLVLQAVGRSPNGKKIGAEKAGVAVSDRGFIPVDIQMRTNVPHIFAIGDIVGQPMLAHKAVHEAHVAAEVIAGEQKGDKELSSAAFNARRDPERGLHRPRGGVGGPDRRPGQGRGHQGQEGPASRGPLRAAPSPTAATRASPSCCSTPRRTASWAAASSARMRAT